MRSIDLQTSAALVPEHLDSAQLASDNADCYDFGCYL